MNWLKKLTLSTVLVVFLGLLTTASLTSCGKLASSEEKEDTEQPAEEAKEDEKSEHPEGESEHPKDSTEHPSDTTQSDSN